MNAALQIAKMFAIAALTFLLLALGIAAVHVDRETGNSAAKINALIVDTDNTVKRANLTLKESDYLILKAGLTADSAKLASDKELVMLDQWNRQITRTMGDVDGTVRTAGASMSSLTLHSDQTIDQVRTTIAGVQPTLAAATTALQAANGVLSNPDIQVLLANSAGAAKNINGSTANLDATTAEVRQAVHSYLHPTWPKRIWDGVTGVGIDVGRILF